MSDTLPVLALKNTVVYPQIVVPLAVGRSRSLAAIKAAADRGQQLITVAQRDENEDEPDRDGLHDVGTLVQVTRIEKRDSGLQVIVQGHDRVQLGDLVEGEFLEAHYDLLPQIDLDPGGDEEAAVHALLRENLDLAQRIAKLFDSENGDDIYQQLIGSISDP
ncbi:MAG: LON peptidase substrate-binding domain-containing protein, partial [Pseudomonadota bacterium]